MPCNIDNNHYVVLLKYSIVQLLSIDQPYSEPLAYIIITLILLIHRYNEGLL